MAQKPLSQKEVEAIRHIRNALLQSGKAPSVRELQRMLDYKSPRSASDILARLDERGIVRRREDGKLQLINDPETNREHGRTVHVPVVGMVPCGMPLLAEENIEAMVPVSTDLARPPHRYFVLRALGDSMNRAGISNGDLVLVRQQQVAENGDRVVALIDDEATIKQYHRAAECVVLRPKSTNKGHNPIVLTDDFQIQGVVTAVIPAACAEE